MSAKDRRAKEQREDDKLFATSVQNGLRLCLGSPDGRVFLWWLYSVECRVEGTAELGQRSIGMALAMQAKRADFDAWQLMRDEHERPRVISGQREEAEPESDF